MIDDNTSVGSKNWSVFKQTQVRYKRQVDAPDRLDDVDDFVDFGRADGRIQRIVVPKSEDFAFYKGPVYGVNEFPGFLYAPQALSELLQAELSFLAVSSFCERPHSTNIDKVPCKIWEIDDGQRCMWEEWKLEQMETYTEASQMTSKSSSRPKYRSFRKLSWATMGYHYDWNTRSYNEKAKSPMPKLLERIAEIFAATSLLVDGQDPCFTASASIVNFYTPKSMMGGHRDDLEHALDKPIVSISLGRPAVFLLGGNTKDDQPVVAILVRPGDVMMMGGASRLRYHGMARLLPTTGLPSVEKDRVPDWDLQLSAKSLGKEAELSQFEEDDRRALASFLEQHRININVRQVYSGT
jgi:DNA alkylation damage repair protein AlkB